MDRICYHDHLVHKVGWDSCRLQCNLCAFVPNHMQLLGVHALSGCGTVSYSKAENVPGLSGQEDATDAGLRKMDQQLFLALYGLPHAGSMNVSHYRIYTRSEGK